LNTWFLSHSHADPPQCTRDNVIFVSTVAVTTMAVATSGDAAPPLMFRWTTRDVGATDGGGCPEVIVPSHDQNQNDKDWATYAWVAPIETHGLVLARRLPDALRQDVYDFHLRRVSIRYPLVVLAEGLVTAALRGEHQQAVAFAYYLLREDTMTALRALVHTSLQIVERTQSFSRVVWLCIARALGYVLTVTDVRAACRCAYELAACPVAKVRSEPRASDEPPGVVTLGDDAVHAMRTLPPVAVPVDEALFERAYEQRQWPLPVTIVGVNERSFPHAFRRFTLQKFTTPLRGHVSGAEVLHLMFSRHTDKYAASQKQQAAMVARRALYESFWQSMRSEVLNLSRTLWLSIRRGEERKDGDDLADAITADQGTTASGGSAPKRKKSATTGQMTISDFYRV